MADKPKVPKPIEEYFTKKRASEAYFAAHDEELINAHRAGVEKIIKARKSSEKDPEKQKKIGRESIELEHLSNPTVMDNYVSGVRAHLLAKAKEELGLKGDAKFNNPFAEEKLLHQYSGFTELSLRDFYRDMVNGNKQKKIKALANMSEFTSARFINQYAESDHAEHVRNVISSSVVQHLNGSQHIEDILKYTGAGKHIDDKTYIRSGLDLLAIIENHRAKGSDLDAKETYSLLPDQAKLGAKYHAENLKLAKKDREAQAGHTKLYTPPKDDRKAA